MIQIELTKEIKDMARFYSDEVLENMRKGDSDYTNINAPDKFYNGYLGELAFTQLLKGYKRKAVHQIHTKGVAAGEDFVCSFGIGDRPFDVKTNSKHYYSALLVNKRQHLAHPIDRYIGVRLNGDIAEIWGWIHFADMGFKAEGYTAAHEPTYFTPLKELNKIEDLLFNMLQGETVTYINGIKQ